MAMNHIRRPGRAARPAKNWDLKLAAILFVGTCATVSLILPNLQQPLAESEADRSPAYHAQAQAPSPAPAQPPATPLPSNPGQQQAAEESYKNGQDQMQRGHYNAAATAFKQALEKSPDLVGPYIGLGDAFTHLGDYKAAETNARHALSKLKLLKTGQAPDPKLKKELSYAHQVLGIALLHLAKDEMDDHQATSGRMKALEAASHCNLATVFDQSDALAHSCAQQAQKLATHS